MAQILSQIATEAASSRLTTRRNDTLASRLQNNDPLLTHLKLCRKPYSLYRDDFSGFLLALTKNQIVTSVEISWRYLSAISPVQRIQLMESVGNLPSLEKFYMEAIPCDALVAALERTSFLSTLWVGALRLNSNSDVQKLALALSRNVSLTQININNIRLKTHGSYRVDNQGMVWFEEEQINENTPKLDLNPLLLACSALPNMQKMQFELQLRPERMTRLTKETLRNILSTPPKLTFLMLSSCDLDDDDITVIAEELQGNKNNLETLNLYRNTKITEIGWRILANMLETNYNLTCLFTPETGVVGGSEPPYQTERFRHRSAIRNAHLRVPAIPPTAESRKKMDLLLRLNGRGRKRLLRDPSTTRKDWVEFLAKEINDIDMSFYVLQAAPGLFVA